MISAWSIFRLTLLGFGLYVLELIRQKAVETYRARKNQHWERIPASPRHWLWGNLVNDGPSLSPGLGRHTDYGMQEIWKKLDCPPAYLLDLYPVNFGILVVADPTIADLIVEPSPLYKTSPGKSDTYDSLRPLIGSDSILDSEGEVWRVLRRRFNKGFAPQHLHSLLPLILSKMEVFQKHLERLARSEETFFMKDVATDLTVDIITELAFSIDLGAQTCPPKTGEKSWPFGLLTLSRLVSHNTYMPGQGFGWHTVDIIRPVRAYFYETVYDWRLYNLVAKQLLTSKTSTSSKASRSITALASEGLEITSSLIRSTVSQVKTFLFAGQDTTSTLLQWVAYEFSLAPTFPTHAAIHAKLCAEHDKVFGPGAFSALAALADPTRNTEELLSSSLPYTTAFVKEILRLHPPAATARMIPDTSAMVPEYTIPLATSSNGSVQDVAVNGLRIYINQYIIHRNHLIWGPDADELRPERFLDKAYMDALPPGAYRPFERGPRNCIGQTLAMMESVIGVCVMTRGFEWRKEGSKKVWHVQAVTSVPSDGMEVSVRLAEDSKAQT